MRAPEAIDGPPRPYEERKRLGAWYTPDALASRIWRRAAELAQGPIRFVLDPCAGDGAFLLAAFANGLDRALVCGVDTDPLAVEACRERVPAARLVIGDALLSPPEGGVDWNAAFGEAVAHGGFDLIVGNPPWEVLEAAPHRPEPSLRAYVAALRRSGYPLLATARAGGGKINLYRAAIAKSLELLRPDGLLCMLVPGGLLRDAGSQGLRDHLLDHSRWLEAWELTSGPQLFPTAHRDLACCAVFVRKGGRTEALRLLVPEPQRRPQARGTLEPDVVALDRHQLGQLGGPDRIVPRLSSAAERDLMIRLWRLPSLSSCVRGMRKGDVNLATDRALFVDRPTPLVLRTGKEIAPYRVTTPPSRWVDPARIGDRGSWRQSRVAWRDIADRTLKKRMCAALVPAGSVLGDTLNFLILAGGSTEAAYYLAVLNSHVFEWGVRRRSAHNHLGQATVGPCPVPPYRKDDPRCREVADLAWRAGSDPAATVEADALAAHLYGLSVADLALVLEGFPKEPLELKDAIRRAFARRSD